jgi:hypothetical protein
VLVGLTDGLIEPGVVSITVSSDTTEFVRYCPRWQACLEQYP